MSFLRIIPIRPTARTRMAAALVVSLTGLLTFATSPALAVESVPQWTVTAVSAPTNFKPGSVGEDLYRVTIQNTGGANSNGEPVTITDELPDGLTLASSGVSARDVLAQYKGEGEGSSKFKCQFLTCTYTGTVVPDDTLILTIPVNVAASPPPSCEVAAEATSCVTNVARVSGGGAPDASLSTHTTIAEAPASFGICC
jgi:uncharacterized repeat protein (TIGR01451 family)